MSIWVSQVRYWNFSENVWESLLSTTAYYYITYYSIHIAILYEINTWSIDFMNSVVHFQTVTWISKCYDSLIDTQTVYLWFMKVVFLACEEMKDIDMNWSETAVMCWVKADLSVWWCSLLVFNRILFAFLFLIFSDVHSFALDEK